MNDLSWGAILYGTLAGFAGTLLIFVVLGLAGLDNDRGGQTVLILLVYLAFLVAGLVAGRFAAAAQAVHGGIAAMILFGLQVVLSAPSPATIFFGLVTATIIGSAGGVLGQWIADRAASQVPDSHEP